MVIFSFQNDLTWLKVFDFVSPAIAFTNRVRVYPVANPFSSKLVGAPIAGTSEDPDDDGSFTETVGAEEFLNEFGGNAIKSPFQDGHYIYTVVAGGGSGQSSYSPILFIADLESPKTFNKKLQP